MTLAACAQLVQRGDPDRFLATMAAPEHLRRALFALFAFNLEIARAPWVTKEPLIAEMRLQWWMDVLDEVEAGKIVRSHEVSTELQTAISSNPKSKDYVINALRQMVRARRHDIHGEAFGDVAALWDYLSDTSGALMAAGAATAGASDTECNVVRKYGAACGLAQIFIAWPALMSSNRAPVEDISPAQIRALVETAKQLVQAARKQNFSKTSIAILRPGGMTETTLRHAHRNPDRVKSGGLVGSDFAKKGRLLLRASLGKY
jgi:phytoene synthase